TFAVQLSFGMTSRPIQPSLSAAAVEATNRKRTISPKNHTSPNRRTIAIAPPSMMETEPVGHGQNCGPELMPPRFQDQYWSARPGHSLPDIRTAPKRFWPGLERSEDPENEKRDEVSRNAIHKTR